MERRPCTVDLARGRRRLRQRRARRLLRDPAAIDEHDAAVGEARAASRRESPRDRATTRLSMKICRCGRYSPVAVTRRDSAATPNPSRPAGLQARWARLRSASSYWARSASFACIRRCCQLPAPRRQRHQRCGNRGRRDAGEIARDVAPCMRSRERPGRRRRRARVAARKRPATLATWRSAA